MSREILFRAKRKSDGEWIFGNLLQTNNDGICIIQNHVPHHLLKNYEVDTETVCQYIGLTDKNGSKIFEGDIVKISDDEDEIYTIEWDNDTARFVILQRGSVMCDFDNYWGYEIEVISNIFDNPELLDGSTE